MEASQGRGNALGVCTSLLNKRAKTTVDPPLQVARLAEVGPEFMEFGPKLGVSGPTFVDTGRFGANFDRIRTNFDRPPAKFVELDLNLDQVGQTRVKLHPTRAIVARMTSLAMNPLHRAYAAMAHASCTTSQREC